MNWRHSLIKTSAVWWNLEAAWYEADYQTRKVHRFLHTIPNHGASGGEVARQNTVVHLESHCNPVKRAVCRGGIRLWWR
jgi:hypothetical protein